MPAGLGTRSGPAGVIRGRPLTGPVTQQAVRGTEVDRLGGTTGPADPVRFRSTVRNARAQKSIRITTRRRVGRLTSVNPASAKTLRLPTWSSPGKVTSCPGSVIIG
jgi:hypothetical protein